ncbi:MAG TPA: polysaccharide deacetylase family protein [Usitatibacter sp.]|nr:polysaccharide deacetylase family protein [Usitatibacter sp.]
MKRSGRVPILTWHAQRVDGPGYARNDHVAFARDLDTIHALGLRVVSLQAIAAALVEGRLDRLQGCVGLSFDDGSDFDFHDLPHPAWGPQRGFTRILQDFRARHGAEAQPSLHATSFVIVSPGAREVLDRTCMIGCRWWNDDWWREAEATGLVAVESHGWDHNHASLERTETSAEKGTFDVRDAGEAEREIGNAAIVLREKRGRAGPVLFAYPYGPANEFLADGWLPRNAPRHGIVAAFAAHEAKEPATRDSSRWRIPRYMFGDDWKDEGDLAALLRDAGAAPPKRSWFSRLIGRQPEPVKAPELPQRPQTWREHLRTWEVNDARVVAGDLFRRSFGHDVPDYPRHFVCVYSPPSTEGDTAPKVVAYVHQRPFEDVHLGGGMCVDAVAYRKMPRWLFEQVRDEGGLATIVTRDSLGMLGDSPAGFGHVGEPRARQADLRTGYVDTGVEHLMVYWRKPLSDEEKQRIIAKVAAIGAF